MRIFLGPYSPPITGQSSSFRDVYDHYRNKKVLIDSTIFYKKRVLNTVYVILATLVLKIVYPKSSLYFTISRTKSGFMKEVPILFLSKLFGCNVATHIHGLGIGEFYSSVSKPFQRLISSIDKIIVLFEGSKEEFRPYFRGEIHHINNWFNPLPYDSKNWKKRDYVLYLSNIMSSKGVLFFLDACEKFLGENFLYEVKVAGIPIADHELNEIQIAEIFQEKLTALQQRFPGRIEYLGEVKGSNKVRLLKESRIFVLPTHHPTEAQPVSIIEAMYYECAVITTNHNHLPEMISNDNGKLIETKSPASMSDALLELTTDSALLDEIGKSNKKQAELIYDPSKNIDKVLKLLSPFS